MTSPSYSSLITLNQKRLYSYIYSLMGHRANTWDVLQETNLVLLRKQQDFKVGTNFEAWSTTIARYQVLAFLRNKQREKIDILTPEIIEAMAPDSELFAESMDAREKALQYCKKQLPTKSKKILQLFYEQAKSIKDIAALRQIKESAIKQTLRRARMSLHTCIHNKLSQAKP
jgi:RNA polymerase sigma-70 factor (ECF subfamily)